MGLRSRTRDLRNNISGTLWYNGTLLTRTVPVGTKDTCYDAVGLTNQDNNLDLVHDTRYLCQLNGTKLNYDGTVKYQFIDYPCGWAPGPFSTLSRYPVPTTAQKGVFSTAIAAKTNPSVPHVSVPTVIGELRDIPGMIKGWGDELRRLTPKTAGRAAANGWLSWVFGIRPMVSDLSKMMNFVQATQARIKWLNRLRSEKHIHRKCMLETDEAEVLGTTNISVQSLGGSVSAYRDVRYTKKVWGSCTWKVLPDAVIPSVEPNPEWLGRYGALLSPVVSLLKMRTTMAERLTYGFTVNDALSTLWELTPWSWLVDWFAGIGNWLDANNNTLPLRVSNICLMRTLKSETTYRVRPAPYSDTWISIKPGPWTEVEERKERYVLANPDVLPALSLLPALNGGQLSILASLAVVKSYGSGLPGLIRLRR